MKKFLIFIFFASIALGTSAQTIYSKITKVDKFDDVLWTKQQKTIITTQFSTVTVETKGQKPIEYDYVNESWGVKHIGSRDNIVNLVDDIYGYETTLYLFPKGTIEKTFAKVEKETPDSLATAEMLDAKFSLELMAMRDDMPTITFRKISWSQYNFEYKSELAWIIYKDGSRIIYNK